MDRRRELRRDLRVRGLPLAVHNPVKLTLMVMNVLSLPSKTVVRTCLPSSRQVMPTYKDAFRMTRRTPSERMTRRVASVALCLLSFRLPTPRSRHPPCSSSAYSLQRVW